MARRVFYKSDQDRYDVFIGVKITNAMDDEIEAVRARSGGRRKAEFVRLLIDEGLKSWCRRHVPVLKRQA